MPLDLPTDPKHDPARLIQFEPEARFTSPRWGEVNRGDD
jgi:hypothetical protein